MNLEQRDGGIGMSELKPCPFCGVQPELIGDRIYAKHGQFCILYSQVVYDFKKTAWNTRPIEDELRATIRKMDQEHTQSLDGKLAMVGKLEELEGLRKKLSRAYYHLRRVIGDHNAPGDCYSTGPHEGNAMDHICPSCAALRELGKELI